MIKNFRADTRSGYALVVGILIAGGWFVLQLMPRWWVVSALAALGLPATLFRLERLGLPKRLALVTLVPGVGLVVAAVLLAATPPTGAVTEIKPRVTDVGLGILATVAIGAALAFLSTNVLGQYGWTLFVSIPFILGLLTAVIATSRGDRPTWIVMLAVGAATVLTGTSLFLASLEGAICLIMAAPLAIPLSLLGGVAALALQRLQRLPGTVLGVAAIIPALLVGETVGTPEPGVHRVKTQIVVAAPPRAVWRHVVSFPPLPAARELVFRAGIAHPIGAVIEGSGVGALRRCRFSTGDFVEPITVWDEPRRLAFDVVSQPESMTEVSPYGSVHAPHLNGFLTSERGEFLLVPVSDGRTLLIGTTWYRNRMWPAAYWHLWSDMVIHSIHRRVLDHVRRLAEAEARLDGRARRAHGLGVRLSWPRPTIAS